MLEIITANYSVKEEVALMKEMDLAAIEALFMIKEMLINDVTFLALVSFNFSNFMAGLSTLSVN